jgi:hypothetical protein
MDLTGRRHMGRIDEECKQFPEYAVFSRIGLAGDGCPRTRSCGCPKFQAIVARTQKNVVTWIAHERKVA